MNNADVPDWVRARNRPKLGTACDFTCAAYGNPKQVASFIANDPMRFQFNQLIYEGSWVHISFSENPKYQVLTYTGGVYVPGIV